MYLEEDIRKIRSVNSNKIRIGIVKEKIDELNQLNRSGLAELYVLLFNLLIDEPMQKHTTLADY